VVEALAMMKKWWKCTTAPYSDVEGLYKESQIRKERQSATTLQESRELTGKRDANGTVRVPNTRRDKNIVRKEGREKDWKIKRSGGDDEWRRRVARVRIRSWL
jgi:hypothetical protein